MIKDESFGIIPFTIENKVVKYLIIHHQKGHWAFPKGHAQAGESNLQTAQRELFEETGLKTEKVFIDQPFIERYVFIDPQGQKINKKVTFFLGEIKDTQVKIQESELQNFAWVDYQQALDMLTFNQAKHLLKQTHSFLLKHHQLD